MSIYALYVKASVARYCRTIVHRSESSLVGFHIIISIVLYREHDCFVIRVGKQLLSEGDESRMHSCMHSLSWGLACVSTMKLYVLWSSDTALHVLIRVFNPSALLSMDVIQVEV
jgi:hypothetical protein